MTKAQWSEELKKYMAAVIERYKNSPALVEYQLENEYFLKVFGICPDHSRDRLTDEYEFVKSLDPGHPVTISRSNNAIGLPLGPPRADEFSVSVYKRVWDKTLTKRYYEYPFPAWFYGGLAGWGELLTGKNLFIHELQAEALYVVDRVVHGMDLELAAVARARIDLADDQRAAEHLQDLGLDLRRAGAPVFACPGRFLADEAGAQDLEQDRDHQQSTPE